MLTVDMFPINVGVLPKIYVYEIETSENKNSISGKLAYRMKKEFKGHWASNYGRIFLVCHSFLRNSSILISSTEVSVNILP